MLLTIILIILGSGLLSGVAGFFLPVWAEVSIGVVFAVVMVWYLFKDDGDSGALIGIELVVYMVIVFIDVLFIVSGVLTGNLIAK